MSNNLNAWNFSESYTNIRTNETLQGLFAEPPPTYGHFGMIVSAFDDIKEHDIIERQKDGKRYLLCCENTYLTKETNTKTYYLVSPNILAVL